MYRSNKAEMAVGLSLVDDGFQDVALAGNAEALIATAIATRIVIITAKQDNIGSIYVGVSDVDNTRNELVAGQVWQRPVDLRKTMIYIDSSENGEGAFYELYY